MSFYINGSRKAPYLPRFEVYPDATSVGEARRAAMAFALGETDGEPQRKSHRGMLPDVDMALAVRVPRRSLLERLFGTPRALKNHHKPSSRTA